MNKTLFPITLFSVWDLQKIMTEHKPKKILWSRYTATLLSPTKILFKVYRDLPIPNLVWKSEIEVERDITLPFISKAIDELAADEWAQREADRQKREKAMIARDLRLKFKKETHP